MPRPPLGRRRRAPCAADVVLAAVLVAAVPASQRAVAAAGGGAGRTLELQAAGVTQVVPLHHDADYPLGGPAGGVVVRVQDGRAWITDATCRDRLCMRMGTLRGPGRALVCLPNRIVVRVRGDAGSAGVDAIAR